MMDERLFSRLLSGLCLNADAQGRTETGSGGGGVSEDGRQGHGVEELPDGGTYEGGVVNGLKHGAGRSTGRNGESYEGSFYKDYMHGDGVYCWPTGHKFTGKYYLNRREGYGKLVFPDGGTFQGLYHSDQRFGPGVISEPDGRQDVGLWLGQRLIKLCTSVKDSFTLKAFPEFAAYMDTAVTTDNQRSQRTDTNSVLSDESWILPLDIESYSTNGDYLPLPVGRRKELDKLFFGESWEPDSCSYQGYDRDPLSILPLPARMLEHIHKHRLQAADEDWAVAAVLSSNRDTFGPKGPLEVSSERLIQCASRGELQAVSEILQKDLVHPDVADSRGNTALIAATVNGHDKVIHLLLDMGVDIDKLNCEGMSALAICHVLYYHYQSLYATAAEPAAKAESTCRDRPQISEPSLGFTADTSTSLTTDSTLSNQSPPTDPTTAEVAEHTVQWKKRRSKPAGRDKQDRELTSEQTLDSNSSGGSYNFQVTEEAAQRSAEALNHNQHSDTQETGCRMSTMNDEQRVRMCTLKLLLERGADPNMSRVPVPVLFLAVMAGDAEAVKRLLLCGAHTDIPLPPERKGLYPLHAAAALSGPEGPIITELLLHAAPDPDARACDENEVFEPDRVSMQAQEPLSPGEDPDPREGGSTALHMVCQRDGDSWNARTVALLLSHRARTDLLWNGHSPLSLAIASGNDMAVEELLKGGADPNLPLGRSVGSALCALANIHYHWGNRAKLLEKLEKAGADILMPVMVGDELGTAVDYAHHSFNQDPRIANTPFHALNMREREQFKARQELLSMMADLLRQTASRREHESEILNSSKDPTLSLTTEKHWKTLFKFCYTCGRCVDVKLTVCRRCRRVFYCSRSCRQKAREEGHMNECQLVSAFAACIQERVGFKTQRTPKTPKSSKTSDMRVSMKENYSYN